MSSDFFSNERIERIAMAIGPPAGEGRWYESLDDYLYEGQRVGNLKMRIMAVNGHPGTEVAIPSDGTLGISLADVADALLRLPNMRLVTRLTIIDEPHVQEQWLRQTRGNAELCVKAESFPGRGEIRVYASGIDASLSNTVLHEWNHLLKRAYPSASDAFDLVGAIEPLELGALAPFDELASDEAWSYLGEYLADLKRQSADALILAVGRPIRASIWGSALGASLAALSESEFGVDHESHLSICAFIDAVARPQALVVLREHEHDPNPELCTRACAISRYLIEHPARG